MRSVEGGGQSAMCVFYGDLVRDGERKQLKWATKQHELLAFSILGVCGGWCSR
jgi:hypothetical protein